MFVRIKVKLTVFTDLQAELFFEQSQWKYPNFNVKSQQDQVYISNVSLLFVYLFICWTTNIIHWVQKYWTPPVKHETLNGRR